MKLITAIGFLATLTTFATPPKDALPQDAKATPQNYRMHVEFSKAATGRIQLSEKISVPLPKGKVHDIALEYPVGKAPVLRLWADGKLVKGPEAMPALAQNGAADFPLAGLDLGTDFTAVVTFDTKGSGTLFSKCLPNGKWTHDAKALYIRDGKLVYDIAYLGAITGGPKVDDGKPHTAILTSNGGTAQVWLDGSVISQKTNFSKPDINGHVFKIGRATSDFAGDFTDGTIASVRVWKRALPDAEIALLFKEDGARANTEDFSHRPAPQHGIPRVEPAEGATVETSWLQPLGNVNHAELVTKWNAKTLEKGRKIYETSCLVCHGTIDKPGSLPTARKFDTEPFKNGADPLAMFLTLTNGYGQMMPQPQFTTEQKYAVIQYVRETFLNQKNPSQYTEITADYLASLPKGPALAGKEIEDKSLAPYKTMDFGPALFWTYQIEPGNIAQKGIAIRLDEGPGGVSKGRAWMIYDHDTMRMAAATTGDFVDWKGIAFDGSHNSHTSLKGERQFVNPVGPGWASPEGKWNDARLLGRDGKAYGPLPKEWAKFEGIYLNAGRVVVAASINGTRVLESPGWIEQSDAPVFTRTLNVAAAKKPLQLRVAPDSVNVSLTGDGSLQKIDGFWVATLPGMAKTQIFISRGEATSLQAIAKSANAPNDLNPLTHGGSPQWQQEVTTTSEAGQPDGAFIADTFPLPLINPWQSWMRPGGFDFTPDGKAAIVATWNGDVWRVDGVMEPAPASLRWRRIASGLFQPLGVKFRGDDLFITCRDQIALIRDLNGDGETDFIECFNNDAQVTEHFHEFAMGLQTDNDGNFYYAKSGRHGLEAVVPQHGTLLKVSADGSHTDILATGFRAANGVCLNADGSFFVTDQEGFWTPKNRINRVKPGGFYGNLWGYTDVTDPSDSAMEQPMVWMTNVKDRSPAELVWVPKNAWGNLGGSLINLSYGTGRAFVVPHEQVGNVWQGAVCELPIPAFRTGIMRGRFGSDGALYTSGMYAWAGNATTPGGFYRIRRNGKPADIPTNIHATTGILAVGFSDTLDAASVAPGAFSMKAWSLKRSVKYGSNHYDEHPLEITAARLGDDGKTVILTIPALAPTQCYELNVKLKGADGTLVERSLHGTIHELGKK